MTRNARLTLSIGALAVFLAAPALAPAAPRDNIADAVIGQPDLVTPGNGTFSASRFIGPAAVAEDPRTGEFWVSDTGVNRVLRFASARAYANGEAANLVLGQPDFVSNGPNRDNAPAADTMNYPSGLAVDRLGRLYVADSDNNRVLVFAPPFANGMGAAFVLGQPDFESVAPNRGQAAPTAVSLNLPRGVAVDAEGNAWVADTGNARVLRFIVPSAAQGAGRAGLPARNVLGQAGFTTSATALTPTGMNFPVALSFDPAGNLWVADQFAHRITRFDAGALNADGSAATRVLCAPDLSSPSNGPRANGCSFPTGVAVDQAGRVYVADSGYHRVLRFDVPLSGADAIAVIGQGNFTSTDCNRGFARPTDERICLPLSLAVDRRGNLHVPDFGNGRVLRFDEPGALLAPLAVAASPRQIARGGPAGLRLTVTGTRFHDHTVVHWNGAPRPTTYLGPDRLVATLEAGDYDTAGDHTVSVDTEGTGPAGELTVEVYDRAPRDGAADRFLGKAEFAHPDQRQAVGEVRHGGAGAADFGDFYSPALAIDPVSGRLFAVDRSRNRILSWPSAANFGNAQSADLVIGQPDFHTNTANAMGLSARSLNGPGGVAVDGAGRLYVADSVNNRVLRFDPPFATGMAASAVYGQEGSFTDARQNAGGLGRAGLSFPVAVAVHGNRLFVFDGQNRRVLAYDAGAADDDLADAVIGQADFTSAPASAPGPARFASTDNVFLAVDAQGNLFVSDSAGHRVLRFSAPFTNGMAADLVIGQPGFTQTAPALTATGLSQPQGIAFDPTGQLLVADRDSSRVTVYRPPFANGMAAREALGGTLTAAGPLGGTRAVPVPGGLAVDAAGNVFAGILTPNVGGAIVAFDQPLAPWVTPRLVNISTRAAVQAGDNVLIGGFIIGGTGPKTVVVRARGPSLAAFGVAGALANPLLQLFRADGTQAAVNDNWQQAANAAAIQASGFAPAHEFESAVLVTLDPGAYTAIVSGAGGVTGVGIVEVFEVDDPAVPLANISTRGRVLTGENVMIAGFVIVGDAPRTVVVRARGPSLAQFGVPDALANPLLQLISSDGTPLVANDNWRQAANATAIQASGFAPGNDFESAILVTLQPGAYTAIVSGAGGATGVAIVEVFVR